MRWCGYSPLHSPPLLPRSPAAPAAQPRPAPPGPAPPHHGPPRPRGGARTASRDRARCPGPRAGGTAAGPRRRNAGSVFFSEARSGSSRERGPGCAGRGAAAAARHGPAVVQGGPGPGRQAGRRPAGRPGRAGGQQDAGHRAQGGGQPPVRQGEVRRGDRREGAPSCMGQALRLFASAFLQPLPLASRAY